MKLALAMVLSCPLCLFWGAGAPVPRVHRLPRPSGHPSAVLDDAKCQSVWKMASPERQGSALYREFRDGRYKDGTISADEFKVGCGKGWGTGR